MLPPSTAPHSHCTPPVMKTQRAWRGPAPGRRPNRSVGWSGEVPPEGVPTFYGPQVKKLHPGIIMCAEESTSWSGVTQSLEEPSGLGFDFKWDLGWMNDTLRIHVYIYIYTVYVCVNLYIYLSLYMHIYVCIYIYIQCVLYMMCIYIYI